MCPLQVAQESASVSLCWLPLGAGDMIVRYSGRWFEVMAATRAHRSRLDLFHSALVVRLPGQRFVIEMAPSWGNKQPERGVVAEGPVGHPLLGRSLFFRYEVRRWRDGVIPDLAAAVESPRRLSSEEEQAQRLLDLVPAFPTMTWGRDELDTGDMWNSNSLVSWLLARSGHRTDRIELPINGRAPGWTAGLVASGQGDDAERGVSM